MTTYKKYTKLQAAAQYDLGAAEELAEVMNELRAIQARVTTLKEIVDDNQELLQYTWTTADGLTKAIHDIDDDHLKNILQWQVNNRQVIKKPLRAEAIKRGFDIPTAYAEIADGPYERQRKLAASIRPPIDTDPIDLNDIPF